MSIKSNKKSLRTLYQAVLSDVESHKDNPQLILLIGIELNDVDIIQSCLEDENLDVNQVITNRNQHILENFGCDFD